MTHMPLSHITHITDRLLRGFNMENANPSARSTHHHSVSVDGAPLSFDLYKEE